jgi:hypothetical protein
MRRFAIGFTLRLIISTVISLTVWWLFITPFDRVPLPVPAILVMVRILDFPVALAGEVLPIRGMDLAFGDSGSWCDFCSRSERFRQQMRLAIPTYLFLLYVPTLLWCVARRDARLFQRIIIGLLVYTVFTAAFFLVTGDGVRGDGLRIAAIWLAILAAAAAFAWSPLDRPWRIAGIAAVLLLGALAFPFLMAFLTPDMDEMQPYYPSYLFLLALGAGGTLWLTRPIEHGLGRWQRRRLEG